MNLFRKETGVSPLALSMDIVGGEVGIKYSEVEEMGKDGSGEGWEGAC